MDIRERDDRALVAFWDKAFTLSGEDEAELRQSGAEDWKSLAPSEKLLAAAASLGGCKRVLDLGCGSGWAAIAAAKSGCKNVTAADPAPGAAAAARLFAAHCGVEERITVLCAGTDWLASLPAGSFDGLVCSNVLDVVPPETAEALLCSAARVLCPGAAAVVGLNYYLSPEAAAARGMALQEGRLYVDGVLRLVSRTDVESAALFAPCFTVERLEHFAWPGEAEERRRLFYLKKKPE